MADDFAALHLDFVVVGGGTAGLAVAARLAENPSVTVGVLEAGPAIAPGSQDDIDIPAYYGRTLGGPLDWKFETCPQPGLGGRKLPWPRGKVLGGSSALNFMVWNRACREDYDAWEDLGNPGWGWDSLLPFFKKSERFHAPVPEATETHHAFYDAPAMGDSGPIQISYTHDFSPSHALWHATLNSLGVKTNKSPLSGSNVGAWTNLSAVDPKSSVRSYSAHYCAGDLRPRQGNLHVLPDALVREVVLTQRGGEWSATGVRFVHAGRELTVSAAREVILSAGSVQSPQLLELSGVGRPDVLSAANVPVKVESPNVGENLQDHLMIANIFEVDASLANPDDLKRSDTPPGAAIVAAAYEQYLRDRSGPLTILPGSICYLPLSKITGPDVLEAIAARAANLTYYRAEELDLLSGRLDRDKALGQIEYLFDLGNWSTQFQPDPSDGKKYATMLQMLQHPFTRGSIHIPAATAVAADDPLTVSQHPVINPRYYEGPHGALDLELMTHAASFAATIGRTGPLSSIIRTQAYPPREVTGNHDTLRGWVAANTVTDWHPVGTCAMGGHAGPAAGVVDERLRVYGVRGLRVVDASVMPTQIGAHLQATVYAIAEKGASMILEDHFASGN